MNKIYLAARYSRRAELSEYAKSLRSYGYVVTSRWLDGNHETAGDGTSVEGTLAERRQFALEDWADVMSADVMLNFTETPRTGPTRGGRHVEFGAALAEGKKVFVVGPIENVFHALPQVVVYPDFDTYWGHEVMREAGL